MISVFTISCSDDDNFKPHIITSEVVLKDFVYLASPQQPVTPYNQVIYDEENGWYY